MSGLQQAARGGIEQCGVRTSRWLQEVTPNITLSRYRYMGFFLGLQEYTPDPSE